MTERDQRATPPAHEPRRPVEAREVARAWVASASATERVLVVRHREFAVRATHRPFGRSVWP